MIGFENITKSMEGASKRGSLAHAHILSGPDGIGKSPLAKTLGALILDPQKGEVKDRVDFITIEPQGKSIGVDEVRHIVTEANLKPFEGDRKVIMIKEAQLMTIQAQNALLKTIEEPPFGVYFILVLPNADALLPTIRSRCALHRLAPLSLADMKRYLSKVHGLQGERLDEMAQFSMGLPGRVDDFLQSPESQQYYETVLQFVRELASLRSLRDARCGRFLAKNKKILDLDPVCFFREVLNVMRDVSRFKVDQDYKNLIFLYNKEKVEAAARELTARRITKIIEVLTQSLSYLEPGRNINRETIVDQALMQLVEENS